mmetsp:Transcript_15762/g.39302  ORF Transcript_15762/g.39302 Transcript_15762/m.39302 type:complete len:183 (-) Transcript_15762:164-712(-)
MHGHQACSHRAMQVRLPATDSKQPHGSAPGRGCAWGVVQPCTLLCAGPSPTTTVFHQQSPRLARAATYRYHAIPAMPPHPTTRPALHCVPRRDAHPAAVAARAGTRARHCTYMQHRALQPHQPASQRQDIQVPTSTIAHSNIAQLAKKSEDCSSQARSGLHGLQQPALALQRPARIGSMHRA